MLTRLIHIDFPRMQIEDSGRPIAPICSVKQPPGQPIGKKPEIPAARGRDIDLANSNCGQRHLNKSPNGGKGDTGRARAPVKIVL